VGGVGAAGQGGLLWPGGCGAPVWSHAPPAGDALHPTPTPTPPHRCPPQKIREMFHIHTEGDQVPPPLTTFRDMKLPPPILKHLESKGIKKPTPIQIQAMPAALSGRDIIGIAFTGSGAVDDGALGGAAGAGGCRRGVGGLLHQAARGGGAAATRPGALHPPPTPPPLPPAGKTLVFSVPMLMIALQEEMRMPLIQGEGPVVSARGHGRPPPPFAYCLTCVTLPQAAKTSPAPHHRPTPPHPTSQPPPHPQGLIICPSRELASQTQEIIVNYTTVLAAGGFPELRTMLCIGGIDMRTQMDILKRGVHMVVATPGRLKDLLHKKRMNLDICRWGAGGGGGAGKGGWLGLGWGAPASAPAVEGVHCAIAPC
jgi:ATP-dependent RNA helicase DDX41